MSKRRLFNAANIHQGGALQVALSFISELTRNAAPGQGLSLVVSSEILYLSTTEQLCIDDVSECNIYGFSSGARSLRKYMDHFDVVFTLFGPLYRLRVPFKSVVGFAQAYIVYPDNEVFAKMGTMRRLGTRLKYSIQAFFFKRADVLVVELDHVKEGLIRELGIEPERIEVVRNCVSSIFRNRDLWQSIECPDEFTGLRLGFIGRNYTHKNTDIFPQIVDILKVKHGVDARFYVTFSTSEWMKTSLEFQRICTNLGPLSPNQCPAFYECVDAIVFPSLLECFSATPLEALFMGKPLFASDRIFNREVCGSHAHYFDPLSPESAAEAIAAFFESGGPSVAALSRARDHAVSFSSPEVRARQYLSLLGIKIQQEQ